MYLSSNAIIAANSRAQKGAALVVSLILLAVITLLSVSAMRNTNLDTKIAVNHQHKQLSFQAAENALAMLTGDDPEVNVPGTPESDNVLNSDYFVASGIEGQPNIAADVDMDFIKISRRGEYKFSGFSLDVVTYVYQADSHGKISNGNAITHNRMGVALLRQ